MHTCSVFENKQCSEYNDALIHHIDLTMRNPNNSVLSLLFILIITLQPYAYGAEDESLLREYIAIEPVIITNYQRPKGKKPGFVQLQAKLAVYGTAAAETVENNLPLIRGTIIEFLMFTNEATIKDITKRNQLREQLALVVNNALKKTLGYPYVEELVITHFMWN